MTVVSRAFLGLQMLHMALTTLCLTLIVGVNGFLGSKSPWRAHQRQDQPMILHSTNSEPFQWPPHSGYHGTLNSPPSFFEGWYLRIITKNQGSLALIFHVFDPNDPDSKRRGIGLQVLSPNGTFATESTDFGSFHAASHQLDILNQFSSENGNKDFPDYFRLNTLGASGRIGGSVDFDFAIDAQVGWGTAERQYSVAGFLAAFPVFEPHYQVLLSRGRAPRGFLKIQTNDSKTTTTYDLTNATLYLEKNWGGSFPSRWFWIQANTFSNDEDLCVTSTGGLRRLPFFSNEEEQVALVALHWRGKFLPFPEVEWTVQWGYWRVQGSYGKYIVELTGACQEDGFPVNCPTKNGMEEIALESFRGELRVQLFEKGSNGKSGRIVLDATDNQACLEIGGLPWSTDPPWRGESAMREPIKSVAMNVDLENRASDLIQMASNLIEIPGL